MFTMDAALKMVYMMRVLVIEWLLAVAFAWMNGFTAFRSQLRGIFYDVVMHGISLSIFSHNTINRPHRSGMFILSHP
ncbi:MAG: hypothetical protein IKE34_11775 [Paenibacillus sp.]|nr:hypothetical protein [Paenibacillus sp.]